MTAQLFGRPIRANGDLGFFQEFLLLTPSIRKAWFLLPDLRKLS